jgi:hypothetical protein
MRNAQGLPVNMIVLTALALLVLVVVGAFFISGFGQATGGIQVVNATEAECQSMCQGLATSAFNYDSCTLLETNPQYNDDAGGGYGVQCASEYGACTVTIRGGGQCRCDEVSIGCEET